MKYILPFIVMLLLIDQSGAIPAFARKYDMSCNTCHRPVPKVKAYGEEFAANGFQLPEKEPPRFTRETGDGWLYLMRELPFALRLEGYVQWQPQKTRRIDFQAPYLVKLLSGGQIAPDIAYYFYFFFGERGEVAGLEDAFVMFNNVLNEDLDLYVGQFQVSDPLFKRELRLTLEDYQVYRTKVGDATPNLTYDRGIMLTYGLPSKTDITLEVLNGTGIGAMDATRSFDTDAYKNLFVRVSQDVGENIRIGGLGYFGKEEQSNKVNSLWMAGGDATLSSEHFELNMQYVEREDKNPFFFLTPLKVKTRGAFAELIYTPNGDDSRWYGVMLYNWVENNFGMNKYNALTGHASYIAARNLRLIGEYTYDFEHKANKLSVGFIGAF